MKRQYIISSLIFILSYGLSAQDKYGSDPDKCKTNLSIFYEHARVQRNDKAYEYWRYCIDNCPSSSKNLYTFGLDILDSQLINATTNDDKKKIEKEIEDLHKMSVKYFPDYFEKID